MASMFPRVYRSFEDFEKSELRKLDNLYYVIDDMVDEMLKAEFEEEAQEEDDGILFDRID
ncbi:MAG: hypothetical protein V1754_14965 [Pseudomonadota bacterium]